MCGLFGWKFGEEIPVEKRVIIATVLALENETRGKDSWGVLDLQSKEILRELGKVGKGVYRFCMLPEALCHTRFATVGAVTLKNAHPFEYKHIIGSHNGSVSNHWQLNNNMQRDFDCDSEHIFAHIADQENKTDVQAHGAITYLDTRETKDGGGLYLGKFNGGTLQVYSVNKVDTEKPCMIVWSSTQSAIEAALTSAGLEGFPWQVEEGKVYEIKEFTLYTTPRKLAFEDTHKKSEYHGYGAMMGWEGGNVKEKGNLKPYYDQGEIIWNKCYMCGRWVRVRRFGTDDVCAMCEDVYLENKKAEGAKEDKVTAVAFTEGEKAIGLSGLCDYCGTKEADFHIPALQGIVCAECMAVVDAELCSNYEVKMIEKVSEEIQPLELEEGEEGVASQVHELQFCNGVWASA